MALGGGIDLVRKQKEYMGMIGLLEFNAISPLFYLRISEPGLYLNKHHEEALLDTAPHYDRSKIYDFTSIWIPLYDTNSDTGTMCIFPGLKSIREFRKTDGTNIYSLGSYLDNYKIVDHILKDWMAEISCPAGHFLYLGPDVLHGASKSRKKTRVSLNYHVLRMTNRLDSGIEGSNDVEYIAASIFYFYPHHFCAIMLATYGDVRGASKISVTKKFSEERQLLDTSRSIITKRL